MADVTLILGSVGLCGVALFTWYTVWLRRATAACKQVPVRVARATSVLQSADQRRRG